MAAAALKRTQERRATAANGGLMLLITAGIAAFFSLPVYLLARKDKRLEAEGSGAR